MASSEAEYEGQPNKDAYDSMQLLRAPPSPGYFLCLPYVVRVFVWDEVLLGASVEYGLF